MVLDIKDESSVDVDDDVEYLLEDENNEVDDDDDYFIEDLIVEDTNLFHCSTCNTNFESVQDHIREFHADEDVQVEETVDNIMFDEIDEDNSNMLVDSVSIYMCKVYKHILMYRVINS